MDMAGSAAVNAASSGGILENFNGPKNMIKVISRTRNRVIRSNLVEGGDKKILAISIFTFIFIPAFRPFLPPVV